LSVQTVLERHYPGRRAQLKREILSIALECFNTQGIDPTTIEIIKDRCETSVGAIYHHFANKDGIVAALFQCGQDDLSTLTEQYLDQATSVQEGIQAIVFAYVDWVVAEPELARFKFQAHTFLSKGPYGADLAKRSKERNKTLLNWFLQPDRQEKFTACPLELLLSLLIGQSENYCRAWLAKRVRTSPAKYREALAAAAWHSIDAVSSRD
jgi:AcrR family transcriptional regulator